MAISKYDNKPIDNGLVGYSQGERTELLETPCSSVQSEEDRRLTDAKLWLVAVFAGSDNDTEKCKSAKNQRSKLKRELKRRANQDRDEINLKLELLQEFINKNCNGSEKPVCALTPPLKI